MIDARWLRTGIGTYTWNVLTHLTKCEKDFKVCAITRRKNIDRVRPFVDAVSVVDVPIYTAREQIKIPCAARGTGVLHVPHYNVPLMFRGKLLVTILDLIHITDPYRRRLASWIYAWPMLKYVARRADHVITISEYSKSQIIERLRIAERKITVTYCGVTDHFRPQDPPQGVIAIGEGVALTTPYILYVGSLKPHKNVLSLLRAFGLLRRRKHLEHQLMIVGDDAKWKADLVRECDALGIADCVVFIPDVSYDVLPRVYAGAELLVMPSFIEGFGLTVLEAMACGTPVVSSRAASLPEVAGDAAEFFDPSSPEDIAASIERVLGSSELRSEMRRKGLKRATQFSWSECATRHCQIYRQLLL